jgi:hypothetical protein
MRVLEQETEKAERQYMEYKQSIAELNKSNKKQASENQQLKD